jgi:hypothetical protein
MAPVPREYVVALLDRIDETEYGWQVGGGKFSPKEQKMRNKALVSLLYLSARRISELVGRTYTTKPGKRRKRRKRLVWRGVKVSDFSKMKIEGRDVLVMKCEILKKSRRRPADVILSMEDHPFIDHITVWIDYLRERYGEDTKLFDINRFRCFQLLKQLDPNINNHWFRHMRLSHLAEYLNPYQLTERIGFWESVQPAINYVHGRVSDYLEAVENICERRT